MLTLLAKINLGEAFKLKGNLGIGSVFHGGLRGFIATILPTVFILAGLILLALIIFGGIGMITSAGNPEAQQKNQGVVAKAAAGFFLIIGAYWVIQIIEVITGVSIL